MSYLGPALGIATSDPQILSNVTAAVDSLPKNLSTIEPLTPTSISGGSCGTPSASTSSVMDAMTGGGSTGAAPANITESGLGAEAETFLSGFFSGPLFTLPHILFALAVLALVFFARREK